MKNPFAAKPNGYLETIKKGVAAVRQFDGGTSQGSGSRDEQLSRLKKELASADAVVIGAGAGLSTAAGFIYSGARFERFFSDLKREFGIRDMYTGGFYPFPDEETYWAFWSRNIYFNRYVPAPKPVYETLLALVKDRDYFVITTNVDHLFQRAGFDKTRLFYTQGDYGLFQAMAPKRQVTWDNEAWVMQAMEAQGFERGADGIFDLPASGSVALRIPAELVPVDPESGGRVVPNLRVDDSFVEDEGWQRASAAYSDFLRAHGGQHVLFLELGVGNNTPIIIKYPFWQMTYENPRAVYACLNHSEACCPKELAERSICLDGDCGEVLKLL